MVFFLPFSSINRLVITVHWGNIIDRIYQLNPGTTPVEEGTPHEKPHKPLLLLAAIDLIDEGKATASRIPWCQELRDRFSARFLEVKKHNDQNTPENPFYYLQTQGFWQAWVEENGTRIPLQKTPLVNQMGRVYACFADGFEHVMANSESRQKLREALISRYFPQLSTYELKEPDVLPSSLLEEEPAVPGRSSAFRRLILDIYDHQCAACGLRIRLPTGNDITFVDAAHLIPFSESHNDHPSNGLALCKNHHWAMDRNIIAPGPDFHWHISKVIDPRRSKGEKELAQLAGQSLLLPNDPAFLPDMKGLNWRRSKMIA